jgi:hypothetical protein
MGSIVDIINRLRHSAGLGSTPNRLKPFDIEESPRVSVEGESNMNIRVHKVANGWVISKTIENSGSYESETHVCGNNDDLLAKVNELVAMFKIEA